MKAATARAERTHFRLDIQGLRAIAVGAVVLYHAGVPFLPGGYVGVDVFFVISGFLITSHLLSGLTRDGRVGFAEFYARRARRILPASFVVLLLSVLAALLWFPPLLLKEVWRGAVATALYVPNILFAVEGTNYLAETTPSLFQHYWSLGVEEQFYLVWPLLLVLGWRLLRSRRVLFVALLALVAMSFGACVYLTYRSQPLAFFLLPTRAWELGVGGIVAFLLSRRPNLIPSALAAVTAWLGLGVICASVVFFDSSTPFPGFWAALPVAGTAAVIMGGAGGPRLGPGGLLSLRGMAFLGAISYSLYLVHWPALIVPQAAVGFGRPMPLWVNLLIVGACVPAAWVMFRFVETPGREVRVLTRARPRRTLWAAAAGSAIAVVVATGAYAYGSTLPLSTSTAAELTVISDPPSVTDFVPSNLTPALVDAENDQPVLYADGCQRGFSSVDSAGCLYGDASAPRIALFGDSHAAQWFPALWEFARASGYAVETFTKSSCPSVSAVVTRNGVDYSECSVWRDAVIARLNEDPPALVVIANYGTAPLLHQPGDYASAWEAALGRTLDSIEAPTVVIADTPDLHETPSLCLSAHLEDTAACSKSREFALSSPSRAAEVAATTARSVPLIDLTDFICTAEVCAPVLGNTLVYRDAHHLTATFSALLGETLGDRLGAVLG